MSEVLFERLADGMHEYIENYYLVKSKRPPNIIPSYTVDYEISQEILLEIEKSLMNGIDDIWYLKISNCNDIKDLPHYLQKLIIQYLPRFLKQYPQYKNHKCLQTDNKTAE